MGNRTKFKHVRQKVYIRHQVRKLIADLKGLSINYPDTHFKYRYEAASNIHVVLVVSDKYLENRDFLRTIIHMSLRFQRQNKSTLAFTSPARNPFFTSLTEQDYIEIIGDTARIPFGFNQIFKDIDSPAWE